MLIASGCLLMMLKLLVLFTTSSALLERIDVEEQISEANLVTIEANADTLIYVQMAWRHGDRTPVSSVPFIDVSTWEEGLGELTTKGIAQQYRLGKWLRARYGKFLGNGFHRSEVYVRSSDYNRTLMSAQVTMAGLFPPSKSKMKDANLLWQPVPVHSVPKTMDKELYEDIDCPTASAEFSTVWNSKVVRRMINDNEDLIKYLGEKSQILDFDLDKLWMVYDNLFCMLQHIDTHKWPSWINASVFDRVQKLYDIYSRTRYHTDNLRRLRGGPLLKDVLDRFIAKSSGTLGVRPKLFAYSAHDTTLAALLATLGIYPTVFPLYASVVLLELHKKDEQLVVEVYHKNETDVDNVYQYEIPGCGDPCTLDALRLTVDRYLPTHWTKECGLAGPNVMTYIASTVILACTTVLLAGVLVLDIMLKKRRRSKNTKDPLISDEEEP